MKLLQSTHTTKKSLIKLNWASLYCEVVYYIQSSQKHFRYLLKSIINLLDIVLNDGWIDRNKEKMKKVIILNTTHVSFFVK